MPISNNASYIPTMNEFIPHWTQVDAALPTPLIVAKPDQAAMTVTDFTALREAIQQQALDVVGFLNDQEIARGDINLRKTTMLALLNEFNGLLDGYWVGTAFLNARPLVPGFSMGEENFLKPMRDMATLWTKLNAGTAPTGVTLPLTLANGMVQAPFALMIKGLQNAYAAEAKAAQDVVLERGLRELNKASAYEVMKSYRTVVPSRCRLFPALVSTLPALTPAGGHTPDAVEASAVFEAPDKSHVTHEASTDADLARYELRGNPGETYDENDAVTILTHTPSDPREFVTNFSLSAPGAKVALKVFVVLTTGNEAGSETMVVQRPV